MAASRRGQVDVTGSAMRNVDLAMGVTVLLSVSDLREDQKVEAQSGR
jgi:hypothetical protein